MGRQGRGGHWNRAGRRSGGNRPTEILVAPAITCAECDTGPERHVWKNQPTLDLQFLQCQECEGVLLVRLPDGKVLTADAFLQIANRGGDR